MNTTAASPSAASNSWADRIDLFIVSWVILFLELACIRWFPSHVLFLTFFTNIVLLACFVGMSIGCLAARSKRNWLVWTPGLLLLALLAGQGVEYLWHHHGLVPDVGQRTPEVVFFGAERHQADVAKFFIPVELLGGFFFVLLTLIFIGPGQELGRALERVPNRIQAYTVNIFGSVIGIVSFALCSHYQLSPLWWFILAAIGAFHLLYRSQVERTQALQWFLPGTCALFLCVGVAAKPGQRSEQFWSPYYRVDYSTKHQIIDVNLIGHQRMHGTDEKYPAYALPYLWERDARPAAVEATTPPFENVMIIGAGSGNDVSRALQFGAKHVDAVEIDPVMHQLGKRDHPDKPYDDPRVSVHLDDGRNFLRSSTDQYDAIIYAVVDSLVLHSSYSNIRLESYLFTEEAFRDIKARLKPNGKFIMYNYFRYGWIVARMTKSLEKVFGKAPLVIPLGSNDPINPDDNLVGQFTVLVSGNTEDWKEQFGKGNYYLSREEAPSPRSSNGFTRKDKPEDKEPADKAAAAKWAKDREKFHVFNAVEVRQPDEELKAATDDWPFLYLREPIVPYLSLRGMAVMGGLAFLLLILFYPRGSQVGSSWGSDIRMFFLGAGFMLVETKAVVHMALLFGSTWMVNSIVFLAVLLMILAANIFVLLVKPQSILPYAIGLMLTLALNAFIPLDVFLGMSRPLQIGLSCLLVFSPILFAAVIFALSFARTPAADRAFGANIAGAMLGGLSENASMMIGFQKLILVAMGFYGVALLGDYVLTSLGRSTPPLPDGQPSGMAAPSA